MKLLPMNPAPPVTSSFISAPRHLPDVFAREVPRQTTLVARRRRRRGVQVGEMNDAAGALAEIAHAVRDAWRLNARLASGENSMRATRPRPVAADIHRRSCCSSATQAGGPRRR